MFVRTTSAGERRVELPRFQFEGATCPELLVAGPEVKEYADLCSMRFDFDQVVAICEQRAALLAEAPSAQLDLTTAIKATWEAAVIAYGRAFVSGVSAMRDSGGRTRFPASVLDLLTSAQKVVHEQTLDLRNKHVGHRVNDWTQVVVTAVLRPENKGERGVLHVGQKMLTIISGGESAQQLREVAIVLRDGLTKRMQEIELDLLSQLKAHSIDDLYEVARAEQERSAQLMELERQRQPAAAAIGESS